MCNLVLVQLCNGVAECCSYMMLYSGVFQLCRGKRHLWDPGESLVRLAGRGAVQRAGLKDQREGIFTQVRAANDA